MFIVVTKLFVEPSLVRVNVAFETPELLLVMFTKTVCTPIVASAMLRFIMNRPPFVDERFAPALNGAEKLEVVEIGDVRSIIKLLLEFVRFAIIDD